MQVDKKGNIINPPIYKVSGDERRKYKKLLTKLKRIEKHFWKVEDIHRIYGSGSSDEDCELELAKVKFDIWETEKLLAEKLN